MTRLTAWILQTAELEVVSYGPGPDPNGKYGFYIGTYDEAPSGSKRPRALVTSDPIYETPTDATQAALKLLETVRNADLERP